MTRRDTRNIIENVLNIKCNFTIYNCDSLVTIRLFNKSDYDDCVKKLEAKKFHIHEKLIAKFESVTTKTLVYKYYLTFAVPKKYVKEPPKTIYDLCGDADNCFELDNHLRNA